MSEQSAPGRYYYTPAELSDLSFSPLVAPPANFVKIAESDLPGPPAFSQASERPPHGPSRRGRNGPTSGQNSRRQDRRWNAGAELGEYHSSSHHSQGHGPGAHGTRDHGSRHERGSRNPGRIERESAEDSVGWLDITPDSGSGFGGFEDGVAEFEKWKESQRSQSSKIKSDSSNASTANASKPASETAAAETKSDTDATKDTSKVEEDTSHKPPAQLDVSSQSGTKDLWESAVGVPQQGSSNSRFSTFFKPAEDAPYSPQGPASGLSQTPRRQLSQQIGALSPQSITPLASQPIASQSLTSQFLGPQSLGSHGRANVPSLDGAKTPLGMATGLPAMGHPGVPSAMGPPGMGAPGMRTPGMAPPGMTPPGMTPPGMTPSGMTTPGMSMAPGMPAPGMSSGRAPGMSAGMNPGMSSGMVPGMGLSGMAPPGMGYPRTGIQGMPGMTSPNYGLTGFPGPGGTQGGAPGGTPKAPPYGSLSSSARSPPGLTPQTPQSAGMSGVPPGMQGLPSVPPPGMQRNQATGVPQSQGADDAFFSGLLSRR